MSDDQLVTPEWLYEHMGDPNLVIVDCRFDLGNRGAGAQQYRQDHIPGAAYMNLEYDLSGDIKEHGGRHPLPDLDTFSRKLGEAGIDRNKHVVAYDNQAGAMAARFWWMLTYLGHPNISLLDGGYDRWRERGYPVTSDIPTPESTVFVPVIQTHMLADVDEVRQAVDRSTTLIDSRAPERYSGEKETLDKKAGHIPGAKNFFWKNNLDDHQQWKPAEKLKQNFSSILETESPIVYCGSGVTACANIFALRRAGFDQAKLYLGSWSDWISYENNPVEKGDG